MRFGLGTIAIAILLIGCIVNAQTASVKQPRFEDYPITETWQGARAALKLTKPSERMFRTQLANASKQPPDFAGHYRFAGWGCGSDCAAGAIIDLQTGAVFPPPLGKEDDWMFCGGIVEGGFTTYRRDSRLMIVRCQEGLSEIGVHYLVWENQRFREILHLVQQGPK
jgi:hypothetical protein